MKLEEEACDCGYKTTNKKSFSNHTRFGCNSGRDYSRESYLRNREKVLKRSRDRYTANKVEIGEKRRARYAANPGKEKIKIKEYSKTEHGRAVQIAKWHRYRSRKLSGKVTASQIRALLQTHKACVICSENKKLEIDHIVPLSKGGNHHISNLQVLCRSCNRKKAAKCN